MSKPRLPQTDSIQKLAQFWDTHDLTDFEDQLEDVAEPIFCREKPITLALDPDEAQAVHDLATSKGVADSELIREWIREKIRVA